MDITKYLHRQELELEGLPALLRKVNKTLFVAEGITYGVFDNEHPEPNMPLDLKFALEFKEYMEEDRKEDLLECERMNHNRYARVSRLNKRITTMLKKPCLFLTLTFTDLVLTRTASDTRRQYVKRFLNQFNVPYIANIDFGKNNGREHYHAVIQLDNIKHSLWKYGAINFERIRTTDNMTPTRLSKYITKLTSHAIKNTTKNNSVLYSKNK